jgi:hypothetical protein
MGRSTAGESEHATQFGRNSVGLLSRASGHIGSSLDLTNRDSCDNDCWWECATAHCDKTRNHHNHADRCAAVHDHHHDNSAASHDHHYDNSAAGHDHHHDNSAAVHHSTHAADDGPYRTVTAARDEPRYRASFVT